MERSEGDRRIARRNRVAADKAQPVVVARSITHRARYREIVAPLSLELAPGEMWIVLGPNGSGKSLVTEMLAGVRQPSTGVVERPGSTDPSHDARIVSFESQERLIARERREDLSAILHGATDPGRTPFDLITDAHEAAAPALRELTRRFGITQVLHRGLRFLSTGEFRKTLLAAAVAAQPRLLVLDEPFDGLDRHSREELSALLRELHTPERCLVVVLNRRRDVPEIATHVLEMANGRALFVGAYSRWPGGRREAAPSDHESEIRSPRRRRTGSGEHGADAPRGIEGGGGAGALGTDGPPLIAMREVDVSYGATRVVRGVTWTVHREDRWMIVGPNGSGKSTLLSLVTGDNTKAYGQDVRLFGHRKGSGESVWEIKRRIGYVSGDLQLAYPLRTTVLDAVLSGFYDSVGLYETPSGYEREVAESWIRRIGLAGRQRRRLRELSFGERRMVLVARAVVKSPELLITDEPTQGLDDAHAEMVLELLDRIGREHSSCLLYVTHNPDERLACITHTLELVPDPERGSRAVVVRAARTRRPGR
jgi:molybdate transport system ATP-binding protein